VVTEALTGREVHHVLRLLVGVVEAIHADLYELAAAHVVEDACLGTAVFRLVSSDSD
jgi:hypothetical protein